MDKPIASDPNALIICCRNEENKEYLVNIPLRNMTYELVLGEFEKRGCVYAVDEEGTIFTKTPGGWTINIFIPR